MNQSFTIRMGVESDLPQVLQLIRELALFERAPNEVSNTLERMREDGFGPNPIFGFLVAEMDTYIVGMSLFYFRYSTWKGKCLYLEDLVVTESYRGRGIGSALFEQTIAFGKSNNCVRMNWQVLDWNTAALDFYTKYGATMDPEWINGSISLDRSTAE